MLRNICHASLYLPVGQAYRESCSRPTDLSQLSPRIKDVTLNPSGLFPMSVHTLTPAAASTLWGSLISHPLLQNKYF